jgi:hypothetical protein
MRRTETNEENKGGRFGALMDRLPSAILVHLYGYMQTADLVRLMRVNAVLHAQRRHPPRMLCIPSSKWWTEKVIPQLHTSIFLSSVEHLSVRCSSIRDLYALCVIPRIKRLSVAMFHTCASLSVSVHDLRVIFDKLDWLSQCGLLATIVMTMHTASVHHDVMMTRLNSMCGYRTESHSSNRTVIHTIVNRLIAGRQWRDRIGVLSIVAGERMSAARQ